MTQLNTVNNRISNPYIATNNEFNKFISPEKDWGIKSYSPPENPADFKARAIQVSAFSAPKPVKQVDYAMPSQEVLATEVPVEAKPSTFSLFGKEVSIPNFKRLDIPMPKITFA